ncbi:MAG: fibrobacter succinogenes major paralogous domain-containing protein [Chitinophagaceae bacterium]
MKKIGTVYCFVLLLCSSIYCFGQTQGNEIQGVEIGSQIWMTKNLDIDRFSNGDAILQAQSLAAWLEASKDKLPAWCYYEENGKLHPEYGKLYNLYAVIDKRGLAPKGWYLPKKKDWDDLIEFCGGQEFSASRLAYFPSNNNTSKPTSAAFSAILGGYRLGTISLAETGGFRNAGKITEWWTSEANAKYPNEQAYYTCMYNAVRKDAVFGTHEGALSGIMGYYIRCFKPGQTPVTPKPVTQVIAKATTPPKEFKYRIEQDLWGGKYSILFPEVPTVDRGKRKNLISYANCYSGSELYVFYQHWVSNSEYKQMGTTDLLKYYRERHAKSLNATIENLQSLSLIVVPFESSLYKRYINKYSCVTYQFKVKGVYGLFKDILVELVETFELRKVFRIGLFNANRYPTNEELNEFYKGFKLTY